MREWGNLRPVGEEVSESWEFEGRSFRRGVALVNIEFLLRLSFSLLSLFTSFPVVSLSLAFSLFLLLSLAFSGFL